MRVAAIDIGTVTTRLLVADVERGTLTEVERGLAFTHLGEGMTSSRLLADAAVARVTAAVGVFAKRARELGAVSVTAAATSAARDSSNAGVLVARVAREGVDLRVIPGDEEARLSFAGATYDLDGEGLLVIDLGGGSTELVLGRAWAHGDARHTEVVAARSFDVGSRRVTDLFLSSDPPSTEELLCAREWVAAEMRGYFEALPQPPRVAVSLAGTATSLVAIDRAMGTYDPAAVHGCVLSRDDVARLAARLAALTLAHREQVVGLEPERAGVIVAGALVLEVVLGLAGLGETVVSEHDILYGLALDEAGGRG
ncbi:MAG: Ppx/GppA family phosphatase [Coriobacteriia bacterium]